ncbi:MAG: NAD(P)-binding domain-containing protein [Jiangellales bacterium]
MGTPAAATGRFDAEAAIIGAGPAGLAAGKALAERGLTFDWFEKGSMVGGLWRIDNDNGGVAAYKTLHLNSSRFTSQFPSDPMPDDWPDYPSHELMAQYFQEFAEQHGLLERITFHAEVTSVEPLPGPGKPGEHGWAVTTSATGTRTYGAVLVANGHHGTPHMVQFAGEFTGESFHSHDYVEPSVFTDKDVVVVGVGNSGMDISCDAAKVARSVHLVTRRGVHVLPKYAFGKPIDTLASPINGYVPFVVERTLYEVVQRLSSGRPQDRGLPKPDHRLLHAHPTVSAELYDRVGHGDIVVTPTIERLDADTVHFIDGTSTHADVLVYATGYDVSLPFLAPEVYSATDNAMPLYQRVVSPDRPGLYFIGFIQTVGANIALFEYQSAWVADLLTDAVVLPTEDQMRDWIGADQAAMAKRYTRSQRHTMQVDYWRYIRAIKEARARKPHPSLLDRVTAPLAGLRS